MSLEPKNSIWAGLLKYFNHTQKKDGTLPDPDSPLSRDIPSSSVWINNTHLCQVQQEASNKRSGGPYSLLTLAQKFSIGKRTAENGVTATLHYYSKILPDIALKVSKMRRFSNKYLLHINDCTHPTDLQELPCKKHGRRLLIGEELDEQVKQYRT